MVVESTRLSVLKALPVSHVGRYVLYWVQASPRAVFNHALEVACDRANSHGKPVLACFGLTSSFPAANTRHFAFLLQGLADLKAELLKRKIPLLVCSGEPPSVATKLCESAVECIVDKGYLRIQRNWYETLCQNVKCLVTQVESNVVVPVDLVSDKSEFAARTIRPKIWKHAKEFLKAVNKVSLNFEFSLDKQFLDSLPFDVLDVSNFDSILSQLSTDSSVPPVTLTGGHTSACEKLSEFCGKGLPKYADNRNIPGEPFQSYMSAYLHFGHISPIEIILKVHEANCPKASKDAFIEELLVRRELSMNFVWYNRDSYDAKDLRFLPDWALKTIRAHKSDKRAYVYDMDTLEKGETHDKFWNAAQLEMVRSGKMHGYMRMYWGKKVIEWSPSAEVAYDRLITLNDKYELDGRDPNGFVGVAWCFGLHDRAHQERPIFGKLRYMNSDGLIRKFKGQMDAYCRMVDALDKNPRKRKASGTPNSSCSISGSSKDSVKKARK